MTAKDRIKRYSRELLEMSLADGRIDSERVEAVLNALDKAPPRNYLAILRAYARRVKREIARSQAVIEYAGALDDADVDQIMAAFSQSYGRDIQPVKRPNPDLIAGLRISIDCDVYENSITSRLRTLARGAA